MDLSHIEERLRKIRQEGDCPLKLPDVISPAFKPNAPHRVGIAHLLLRPRFLLLDPTGTGKTPQTLVAFGVLWAKTNPHLRMLALVGKSALFQWKREAERFLVGPKVKVVGVDDNGRKVSPDARQLDYLDEGNDILLTTYQTFLRDFDTIKTLDPSRLVLVLDEAHALRSTKQLKLRPAVTAIGEHARCVWGLTATSISTKLNDLYGLVEAVRPGTLGTEAGFCNRYMDRVWVRFPRTRKNPRGGGKWHVKGYRNLDHLKATLEPYALQRPLSVFEGQIPALRVQMFETELEPEHAKIYQSIKANHIPPSGLAFPDGKKIEPLTAVNYCQMAVDAPEVLGFQLTRPGAKYTEMVRILTEEWSDFPVIVFSRFASVCRFLHTQLSKEGLGPISIITGECSDRERQEAIEAFTSHRSSRVLIVSLAGGESLNLQVAKGLLFFDLPLGVQSLIQVIGRLRRKGSEHSSILVGVLTAACVDAATLTTQTTRLSLSSRLTVQDRSASFDSSSLDSSDSSLAIVKELQYARDQYFSLRGTGKVDLAALIDQAVGASLPDARTGDLRTRVNQPEQSGNPPVEQPSSPVEVVTRRGIQPSALPGGSE